MVNDLKEENMVRGLYQSIKRPTKNRRIFGDQSDPTPTSKIFANSSIFLKIWQNRMNTEGWHLFLRRVLDPPLHSFTLRTRMLSSRMHTDHSLTTFPCCLYLGGGMPPPVPSSWSHPLPLVTLLRSHSPGHPRNNLTFPALLHNAVCNNSIF